MEEVGEGEGEKSIEASEASEASDASEEEDEEGSRVASAGS